MSRLPHRATAYPHQSFMEREETVARLGSDRYLFGIRDTGTGHIQPMKLLVGLAKQAALAGASLHEKTKALKIDGNGGRIIIETDRGNIRADRALIACNGYIGNLEPVTARHVMPIRSFIGATKVLTDFPDVLPGGEAVADSRFVVRYFRKSKDGRLLFGGREAYTADNPRDISDHIRRQISGNLSGTGQYRNHPCLGRLRRHHHAAPALRARSHARRHVDRRLFRPWRHAVKLLWQALCRPRDRQPVGSRSCSGLEHSGISGRDAVPARRFLFLALTGMPCATRF